MHIELSPKYLQGVNNLIKNLSLSAQTSNSFNASGETIILSAGKDELQQILEADETSFTQAGEGHPVTGTLFEGLKAIIREQIK